MAKRAENTAKVVVKVESRKGSKEIFTLDVFDNRTGEYWTNEHIKERGIVRFLDVSDMKQTLNWNLNGDSSKYRFKWGQSSKERSEGLAYVFD